MFRGSRRSRVHTSCDALSLPCSLVSVCPGKQNHGELFLASAPAAKEGPALQPPLFFRWESSDVTPVVPTERARPHRCLPDSARSHHCSPAGPMTEHWALCISESRPPWRRRDLESAALQSQVFQPCNRRQLLHSAEKVLTCRSLLFVFPAD